MHQGNDLIRHNTVVFSGGQGSLKVFPALVDFIPEARLNLVSKSKQGVIDVFVWFGCVCV